MSHLRKEYGAFVYNYANCDIGRLRKMKILFPALRYDDPDKQNDTQYSKNDSKVGELGAFNGKNLYGINENR